MRGGKSKVLDIIRHYAKGMAVTSLVLGLAAYAAMKPVPAEPQTSLPATALEGDRIPTAEGDLIIQPINHATFVMSWQGKNLYVDPVGEAERFKGLPPPDLILITHEHPDHMSADTLNAISGSKALIVAPESVRDKLPQALAERVTVMKNGESKTVAGIAIDAVPAYNTTLDRLKYHPRGRDNGYVLSLEKLRIYIAGDTEDTPEMRALRNIDVAFVPMNLPYTMTVQQAADAVLAFKPRIVYPYHSRGSDVNEFARLVGKDSGIEVRLRDWY